MTDRHVKCSACGQPVRPHVGQSIGSLLRDLTKTGWRIERGDRVKATCPGCVARGGKVAA